MIISLRGTSGSGKSTIVRAVMSQYKNKIPHFTEGRKRPLFYTMDHPFKSDPAPLAVLGHYETACGGCDTIEKADTIFGKAQELSNAGFDVLFEGLLLSVDVARTAKLVGERHVFFLNTPLQVCLDSINARRAARGKTEPVNPENTKSKHKAMERIAARFRTEAPGVNVHVTDREATFRTICQLLYVPLDMGQLDLAKLGAVAEPTGASVA